MSSGSRSKLKSSSSRSNISKTRVKETPSTEEPKRPQLAWQVLKEEVVKELSTLSVEAVAQRLTPVLSVLSEPEESLRAAAHLDYYVAGYWFARENDFTFEQISAFFTLLHTMLENLRVRKLSLVDNVKELQTHMLGVGVSDETSLKCFKPEHAMLTVEYITSALFQHYNLFEFLFTEQQETEILHSNVLVELPKEEGGHFHPPLEEAVILDFYETRIAPKPPVEKVENVSEVTGSNGGEEGVSLLQLEGDDIKSIMEKMASETLTSYQDMVTKKLKSKEESILSKLAKIEKSF